ncbi:MAG TPA: NFACT family protein [Blastocatellia bacterium]|jgi:predicted ribosome quality control (RQC) complex YloA/Tae2 family protein|nr:NFACT family protein [Blastocatellia bacterium]
MENFYLSAVVREIGPELLNRSLARIILHGTDLFADLRLPGERSLLVSLDPSSPALYLSRRNPRDNSEDPSASTFFLQLRKKIAGSRVVGVSKDSSDRVVRIEVERFDISGDRLKASLIFALTGRSTNAYLTGPSGTIEARFAERGRLELGDRYPGPPEEPGDRRPALEVGADADKDEILRVYFGPTSNFGPLLEREFLARCRFKDAASALDSLFDDVFSHTPLPLVYSAVPLEDFGARPVNLKTDLINSHFELTLAEGLNRYEFDTLSDASDEYYKARAKAKEFQDRLNTLRRSLADEVKKRRAIISAIDADRRRFEDPERLKRLGDLLLANLATARLDGPRARVTDYYDPDQAEIEIEIGEGASLQQAATAYFNRYQKARRALLAIESREKEIMRSLGPIEALAARLDSDPSAGTISEVSDRADEVLGRKKRSGTAPSKRARRGEKRETGRRFISTDGYEIIVGRNDADNDYITFRVARPQDVWLHAADYPGSHVIVRNPAREPVPHRSIREAAALALFYSQAKGEARANVHYTERKFVSKPPKARPGLVRLSSFKTILVEPGCDLKRVE